MIYPVPQKNNLIGNPVEVKSVVFTGDYVTTAEKVFDGYSISVDGGYAVEIKCVSSKKTTYIDEISRLTDEKYFIIKEIKNQYVITAYLR